MPSAVSPQRRADSTEPDDLDRLLDYDNAVEDFLRDIPLDGDGQRPNHTTEQPRDEDQEVQVKRKRNPVPKLDEHRLLSDAGIPRLRKITKSRLKFKGKGHEFSDMSRLLNTYQLWLDDLYPRAKFRDALTMVEKVGHTKRMQVMRRAWLDETKPSRREGSPDVNLFGGSDGDTAMNAELFGGAEEQSGNKNTHAGDELHRLFAEQEQGQEPSIDTLQQQERPRSGQNGEPDDDELDALLAEQSSHGVGHESSKPSRRGPFDDDDADDDELDALMAEQDSEQPGSSGGKASARSDNPGNDFADDEEALASIGW